MEKQKKDRKIKENNSKSKRDKKIDNTQKEIEDLINNLNELLGESGDVQKIFEVKILTKKELFIMSIMEVVFSILVLLGLSGFINWLYYDNMFQLFGFVGITVLLDICFDFLIKRFFSRLLLMSFGTISIFAPIAAFLIGVFIFPFVEVKGVFLAILVFVLYNIIKKIMLKTFRKDILPKMNKRK